MSVRGRPLVALGALLTVLVVSASPAHAEPLFPWFHLHSTERPGTLSDEESGQEVVATAINLGDAAVDASARPVVLTDVLPEHVIPRTGAAIEIMQTIGRKVPLSLEKPCQITEVRKVTCTFNGGELPVYHQLEIVIGVTVEEDAASGSIDETSIAGGGAPPAQAKHAITVGNAPTPFGVENYEAVLEEPGGGTDTQAGSHPFQFTTVFDGKASLRFNPGLGKKVPLPAQLPKDVTVKLPPGLVGNPTAYPRCSLAQFLTVPSGGANLCPLDTVVGVASVTVTEGSTGITSTGLLGRVVPIFNVEPSPGEPAKFGFSPNGVPVFLDASVRTGGDYGVTVQVKNITQTFGFISTTATFWGVPADARHNDARGAGCLDEELAREAPCEPNAPAPSAPTPFLTLPTSCSGEPLQDTVETDSWLEPGVMVSPSAGQGATLPTMDGCDLLAFHAGIVATPDVESASTPTGLNVDVHVPQDEALDANGLAQANVKNISVTLPEGVVLNPAAGDGLQACTPEQAGFEGEDAATQSLRFSDQEVSCPDASKIATVTIKTPLLPLGQYVKGFVYLASPQNFRAAPPENPFSSLLAMYIVAKDPVSGVLVKLPAKVSLNEATGQIATTVDDNPQLPFEDAELHFFGGERAPLATPARCGAYTTAATFEPWSNTPTDMQALHSGSTFDVTTGVGGSACPGSTLPFAPSLSSETTNINAGSFTPLSTTLGREDGDQDIQKVTLHYPPGVSGILSGIPLCPEAQANAGTCDAASQIGETIVSVGLGGDPFSVTGGKVYLTEKYAGAPFGLSIVNPAKAGPFDLQEGRPVVVRAKIELDPHTAALTVTTGAIPRIIEGFPLQIKHVNVLINRPGFTVNPTNCNPQSIAGTISSAEGASSAVSVPFQVTNCAALKFAPKFQVSTSGASSKANGASLSVKLSYPSAAQGTQADIAKVKVDLPKQLPSRLTTIQKACTEAQFAANPAGCPPASFIGHAKVVTPLLPVPLEGPVIFVSHGGEAFPSLIVVLQGYGVRVDLVGATFISKAGITSSTFKTVPDTPFNTFELTLPQGKFSALAANLPTNAKGSFCGQSMTMPTIFEAQNGMEVKQNTPITVTGCPKKKALSRAQKAAAALKACKKKPKAKRAACVRAVRKRYGLRSGKK
ncbi:MAG TPA: hypothetical protein VGX69_00650 [Solirubrobacteraceae bacterium]|jgi:hypothetical protein|nr:hypothetical protein [Solirubrobacteraceae bacterium]